MLIFSAQSRPPFHVLEREMRFYDSSVCIVRLKASLFDNSRPRCVRVRGCVSCLRHLPLGMLMLRDAAPI